ncbi:Gldg family protein [Akkermansiaceae bacterium]|nr:Gldg family protein [Akkermansiaceae bacterium]
MKALKPILLVVAAVALLLFILSFFIEALAPMTWWLLLGALVPLSLIPNSKTIRAAFGTAVLAGFVFFLTQLIGMTSLGHKNIDLTEDDRFTLTDGTKAILSELSEPVVINYYVSRDLRSTPADIKRYIPRIDNLLEEFAALSKDGNISINFVDPKPNTDQEDSAALDQIQQVPISQNENLFFGASISSWDKKTVIPYFNPDNETQLEFDLISAIAEVSTANKPTVGLISPLDLTTGGQTRQGWIFVQYLKRSYNVADLGMGVTDTLPGIYEQNEWGDAPEFLDPEKVPVILVVHPAGITPEAEFQLDQYLLRGGTVIACVDPYSFAAQQSQPRQPQMPGMPPQQGGIPTTSTLPKLFAKWGIKFDETKVLTDGKYGLPGDRRSPGGNPAMLKLNREAMPVEDAIALAAIDDVLIGYGGGFSGVNAPGLEVARLLRSSRQSGLIEAADATNAQVLGQRSTDDKQYDILLSLSGNFETAFPDGDPAKPAPKPEKEAESEGEGDEKKPAETPADSSLKKGEEKGHLYLFSDSDILYDGAAYRLLGVGIPQAVSGNGPLVFNILDQATNSKHLVGARARTPSWRPFTVFQEMTSRFEEESQKEIKTFQDQQQKASDEIQKLQAQRQDSRSPFMNEQQQEALKRLQEEQVTAAKSIRDLQKENQSQIDSIKSGIFWKSLLTVPIIVLLLGIAIFIYRSVATQAR